ncbi:MAG TPA: ankyrin repeat domain-containing protein [Flavisolibacter sp.]
MKTTKTVLCALLFFFLFQTAMAQSGPWAKYDQELKDGVLYREASQGNLEEVKSIIQGGGNVHYASAQQKFTILMAAAGSGKIEVVRYLLSLGADPAAKDWWDQTAMDKARSVGARDIVQLLEEALKGKTPKPEPKHKEATVQQAKEPVNVASQQAVKQGPHWPQFGSYAVGDSILYWVPGGWRKGVVKELGVAKATGKISVDFSERKYLVDPDAYALGNDWYEWTGVVSTKRQPFWTDWFIGEWQIGEVQAHHNEVKNGKETDTYYYMDATETLKVNKNGTYTWRLLNGKLKTGRWVPATEQPGIVLKKAYRDFDWTLHNATTIHDVHIRKLDIMDLKPSAVVGSIKGKRKTTL